VRGSSPSGRTMCCGSAAARWRMRSSMDIRKWWMMRSALPLIHHSSLITVAFRFLGGC